MSIAVLPAKEPPAETRVVLTGIRWSTFEALAADAPGAGNRFTYDHGVLEIMSPSLEHEHVKKFLARMIETTTLELDIAISSAGSTTLKDQLHERGVEADECYYIANEPRIRGKKDIDLAVDPPPDLAVEVDITSTSMGQLGIYAALGVPELWLCDGSAIRIYQLGPGGTYSQESQSPAFPLLPMAQVEGFLNDRNAMDETTWTRRFRDWVRTLTK